MEMEISAQDNTSMGSSHWRPVDVGCFDVVKDDDKSLWRINYNAEDSVGDTQSWAVYIIEKVLCTALWFDEIQRWIEEASLGVLTVGGPM